MGGGYELATESVFFLLLLFFFQVYYRSEKSIDEEYFIEA